MFGSLIAMLPRARSILGRAALQATSSEAVRAAVPVWLVRRLPRGELRAVLALEADRKLQSRPRKYHAAPTVYGFHLSGDTADLIQRRIYLFGVWEPNLSRWMSRRLRPGDVVVDVGANIGYFSLLASKLVGSTGRVMAFEALPSVCQRLEANLASNGVENVEVFRVALGDTEGEIEVFRGPDSNIGRSATQGGGGHASEGKVVMKKGSNVVDQTLWPAIRVIKVDVEGDELTVLRGFEGLLRAAAPGTAVVAEVAPGRLEARGQTAKDVMSFMRKLGFVAHKIPNRAALRQYAFHQPSRPSQLRHAPRRQTDVLFVKRPARVHRERQAVRRRRSGTETSPS